MWIPFVSHIQVGLHPLCLFTWASHKARLHRYLEQITKPLFRIFLDQVNHPLSSISVLFALR